MQTSAPESRFLMVIEPALFTDLAGSRPLIFADNGDLIVIQTVYVENGTVNFFFDIIGELCLRRIYQRFKFVILL